MLIEILERFESSSGEGLALCAPSAFAESRPAFRYTKTGEPGKKDTDFFDKVGLERFLEPATEVALSIPAKKKGTATREIRIRLYRLSPAGQAELERWRAQEREKREQEIRKRAVEMDGIRQAIEGQQRAIGELASSLKESLGPPDGAAAQKIGETGERIERILRELGEAMDRDAREKRRIAETLHRKLEGIERDGQLLAELVRGAPASAVSTEPPRPDPADRTSRVLSAIPADRWLEIPEIHRALQEQGVSMKPGELIDTLRELFRADRINLTVWNRNLADLPAPEHAILGREAKVYFYAKRI
ncbi:MAG: hypothetical protein HY720_12540 [Planctomycetes bacterium]|nr:hypothetical protein [Planctomycetota bacterium]